VNDARPPDAAPARPVLVLAAAVALTLGLGLAQPGEARETDSKPSDWRTVTAAVDRVIRDRLELDGVQPAPRSDDSEFLRRLYLDLVGTVPTPNEVEAFLGDRARDKRARKIDELLAGEAYAENWATWWFRTLTGLSPHRGRARQGQGGRYLAGEGGARFHSWLSEQMASNRPFDEMAADLITATGRTDENGAAGYMARWEGNSNNMAGAVSKNFLGVQIQCAQCHDHIYEERWKQDDFRGMAAFFANTRPRRVPEYAELRRLRTQLSGGKKGAAKQAGDLRRPGKQGGTPENGGDMDGEMGAGMDADAGSRDRREMAAKMRELRKYANIVDVQDAQVNPRQIERMKRAMESKRPGARKIRPEQKERMSLMATTPKFWMGPEAADLAGISRRYLLARWITSEENPYFARALVNKLWAALMGRGIVSPADDFNSFNAPSHPKMLALLSDDFKAGGYDLKRVIRILVNTETYQRTSRWSEQEAPDAAQFAKAPVRPLTIEQLYFSLVRATGVEKRLSKASRKQGQQIQQAIFSTFSFVFDDDEGKEEQDFAGSIPQGLFLMNGELLQRAISGGKDLPQRKGRNNRRNRRGRPTQSAFEELLRAEASATARVERIYLQAYGRRPDPEETREATQFVKSKGDTRQAWEDFFWAVLNSAEFMTNH